MRTIKSKGLAIFLVMYLFFKSGFAQQALSTPVYPTVVGFFALFVPIGTIDNKGFTRNFSQTSVIAFPFGLNLLKSPHLGYSMELVPFLFLQNGANKIGFVLFHPGIMFRYNHGLTFIPRLAFQTDGRYGFTPVLSKIILRKKDYQLYLSLSEAARFGNNLPSSLTTSMQVGITF